MAWQKLQEFDTSNSAILLVFHPNIIKARVKTEKYSTLHDRRGEGRGFGGKNNICRCNPTILTIFVFTARTAGKAGTTANFTAEGENRGKGSRNYSAFSIEYF